LLVELATTPVLLALISLLPARAREGELAAESADGSGAEPAERLGDVVLSGAGVDRA
jgi:hypothetical protein